ncbi:MAG: cytochrome C oxidase subunit IV family protein [Flavobacteriaceae bacterium]|nr:cytochrome C oxidase subunit IV family protein [Flavobacteriaceae bacterium]
MKKSIFFKVWGFLILLTLIAAIVSNSFSTLTIAVSLIVILSVIKFIGVSFYFMELKKAHVFWKTSILVYIILFSIIIVSIIKL